MTLTRSRSHDAAQSVQEVPVFRPPLPRHIHRTRQGTGPAIISMLTFILAVAISTSVSRAGGKEVTVWQKDGAAVRGELLWIDKESILISAVANASEEMLRDDPDAVTIIPTSRVEKLTTEGHSYILAGVGCGLLAGIVVGAIAGSSVETPEVPVFGAYVEATSTGVSAAAGAGFGALAGLLVGAACSSSDEAYIVADRVELAEAMTIARYKGTRPEFLPKGGS